jgi:hypothetical protein
MQAPEDGTPPQTDARGGDHGVVIKAPARAGDRDQVIAALAAALVAIVQRRHASAPDANKPCYNTDVSGTVSEKDTI